MDKEPDPDDENVNSVLAQESSELFHIIHSQLPTVIKTLYEMVPSDARGTVSHLSSSAATATEHINDMLAYFTVASASECRNFLQSMCMLCENIPMRLESRLMSVAWYPNHVGETCSPTDMNEKSSLLPSEQDFIKRPRIDYWQEYISAVMSLLLRRWEGLTEHLVVKVQLENVWVSLRMANRGRDRPDQTPASADRGSRTSEFDGDYGSLESRVTLETFLQGCTGKVTILVGQAGSGKTLLMSCLGQQWALQLGPIPSSYLFILLEFRQLNLLSHPLSLSELLFQYHLPLKAGNDGKRAILDYLLSNPEQSYWVLDGYDEFHSKLTRQEAQRELLDPENPLPVADLISGLLNRQLLPGCTVLVTSRVRSVTDLEGVSDKVGQLLGWGHHEIKEYVHNFFGVKANGALGVRAAELLLSHQHLLAMSSLPALCNICCICLEHLLQEGRPTERTPILEERSGTRRQVREETEKFEIPGGGRKGEVSRGVSLAQRVDQDRRRGGSENVMMDVMNVSAQEPPTQAQIPSTLTQVYLAVLGSFLSRDPDKRGRNDTADTTRPPQSVVRTLSQCGSELCELSQLAWKGLESNKVLFTEDDVSQDVLTLSIRTGIFSKVELRREDGMLFCCYCFIHLTVQEFLAALRIMTSQDISDTQLKKRFSLKTRWTTKSDQRTVFTDSLHLYVCGLASQRCTPALVQLARTSGGTGGQSWVRKRQVLVLKLLKNLCNSTLTGPKVLELCHCVQESQDLEVAQQVVGTRQTLELRNIRLLPNDIDALAFVVNSAGDRGSGLDFGACSMELECLDVLPRCQYVHFLCFRSRKYGDKFAEKLSSILPKFTTLRKLEFCGSSLTATGAASLASALQKCPDITEINLSDNNLKDEGIKHIANVFSNLPRLVSVILGRNNSSLKAVDYLIGKMASGLNMRHIDADGLKEVTVMFYQHQELNIQKAKSGPTISLLNQKWSKPEMQKLAKSLTRCPVVSVLDLSGGQWNVETLRAFTHFLPKFNITKKIVLNDSCSSVEDLVILTPLLSDCPAVMELHIRLQDPAKVSIMFSKGSEKAADEISKTLCLSFCGLLPADLTRVWGSLGASSDLTFLDLSSNRLGNKGLRTLLDALPRLRSIQEINVSYNGISMEGVLMLAGALCSHNSLTHIHISDGGRQQVILKFCSDKSDDKQQPKMFRVTSSSLLPSNVTTLCRRLDQCRSRLELDLSHSPLTDDAVRNLLKALPKIPSLQRLNVSHSLTSTSGALTLLRSLTVSQRVSSVELRRSTESFIHFGSVKAEEASCRLIHFSLDGDNLESLLEILQQGPQLSELDLSSNQLNDEGLRYLLDCLPNLRITSYVNLSNNRLSQQGLLDVASTLCTCDDVTGVEVSLGSERCLIWFTQEEACGKTLSIRESSLERGHLVRLAEILSDCPSLTKLELKNNLLQSDWIRDFVKQLSSGPGAVSVSIEECWIRAEEAVSLVSLCLDLNSNIHTIRVQHSTAHLSLMKPAELSSFSLVDCSVERHHLESLRSIIQRCPLLTELELVFTHSSLGVEGAEFLCSVLPSLPQLTSLSIGSKESCETVAEKLSEALEQAEAIQCFSLSGHVISDTAAQIMARVFPRLRSLDLSQCVWSAAAGLQLVKALAGCVRLEHLHLDSVQLDEENSMYLAHALKNISSICSLKLEGWRMADGGIEQLSRLLPVWMELRTISLSKNLLSDHSGDKLLEALNSCSHLQQLHLSSNRLGDLTAGRMALVLPSLTHITVLDISDNCIGYEGSVSLSRAIKCMKNLTKIFLTSVGTSELSAVAASLAHCPRIEDVGMGWNNCDDKVAVELANIMCYCRKLTRIDLESNNVSVVGAEALVRALQSCPSLQLIRLWRNPISASDTHMLSLKDGRLNFSPT